MSAHVTEIERLVLKTNGANSAPSQDDVYATMRPSLSPSYESLIQVFRMSVTQFGFSDLVSKLIAEEVQQKELPHVEHTTALHVGRGQDKSRFPKSKESNGKRKNELRDRSKVQCFKRGKPGHYTHDCWVQPNESGERHDDHSNMAFNVTEGSVRDYWIMDSGATAHVSEDKEIR